MAFEIEQGVDPVPVDSGSVAGSLEIIKNSANGFSTRWSRFTMLVWHSLQTFILLRRSCMRISWCLDGEAAVPLFFYRIGIIYQVEEMTTTRSGKLLHWKELFLLSFV